MFLNQAFGTLEVILPSTPLDELQQLIAGTSSGLLDSLNVSTRKEVLNAIVTALSKVYVSCLAGRKIRVLILPQLHLSLRQRCYRSDLWHLPEGMGNLSCFSRYSSRAC